MKVRLLFSIILAFSVSCTACSDDLSESNATKQDNESMPDVLPSAGADDTHQTPTGSTDPDEPQTPENSEPENPSSPEVSRLGGLSPEDALAYMKTTPDLVIVEVTPDEKKFDVGFAGAIHIPYTEMDTRYKEIPGEAPVILYCRIGKASTSAYAVLLEKRPDIPELSYIAGEPLIDEYNEWYSNP